MPQSETVESTPNPQLQDLIFTLIRSLLQILGTFGFTWGETVSGEKLHIIAGVVAVLIGVGWAQWQKFKQARLDHAGNVASARAAKAIKVVGQEGVPPV
jgi:hypothetical protein